MAITRAEDDDVKRLRDMIDRSARIVVFTGAGISTESGIPDFRSPGGIWSQFRPIDFREFLASEESRRESWRRRFAIDETLRQAQPNRGHLAVAQLWRLGKLACVITQNIDGLHQAAGVPAELCVEIHGNTTYAACLACGERHELEAIRLAFERDETLPICRTCGGIVKTATISFGQPMPEKEMRRAERETLDADLFLAIGSSLVVYPAAGLPDLAVRAGASLVIINRDPTDMDHMADLVMNVEIGPALEAAVSPFANR